MKADKNLPKNTFTFCRMLVESYMVVLVENYIYFTIRISGKLPQVIL